MKDKIFDNLERVGRQALRRLHPEEQKAIAYLLRKRQRYRPERLKIKSLKIEAETFRGLKPIIVTKSTDTRFVVHGHNPERVTLGSIGNLDFYCYPHIWSDRVFIGLYPNSVSIEETNLTHLWALMMRTRWAIKRNMNTPRILKALKRGSEAPKTRFKSGQNSLNKYRFKTRKTLQTVIKGKRKAQNNAFN
jgi:hypothetical protein